MSGGMLGVEHGLMPLSLCSLMRTVMKEGELYPAAGANLYQTCIRTESDRWQTCGRPVAASGRSQVKIGNSHEECVIRKRGFPIIKQNNALNTTHVGKQSYSPSMSQQE